MSRAFTLVTLLGALVAGWWLLSTAYRELGPQTGREAVTGPLALEKSAEALEEWRAGSGTYAGATLTGFAGITVVRADARGYCVQLTYGGAVYHREGPNGASTLGSCPKR